MPTESDLKRIANEHSALPEGIRVLRWDISRDGNKVTFEVYEFDAANWKPPEPEDFHPF